VALARDHHHLVDHPAAQERAVAHEGLVAPDEWNALKGICTGG
jgi:hypothetical protein